MNENKIQRDERDIYQCHPAPSATPFNCMMMSTHIPQNPIIYPKHHVDIRVRFQLSRTISALGTSPPSRAKVPTHQVPQSTSSIHLSHLRDRLEIYQIMSPQRQAAGKRGDPRSPGLAPYDRVTVCTPSRFRTAPLPWWLDNRSILGPQANARSILQVLLLRLCGPKLFFSSESRLQKPHNWCVFFAFPCSSVCVGLT